MMDMNYSFPPRSEVPVIEDDAPLLRVQNELGWIDNGETVEFPVYVEKEDIIHSFNIPKKTLSSESAYFLSCFVDDEDRYPEVTARLEDRTTEDNLAFIYIMCWYEDCKNIPARLGPAEQQPEISFKEWLRGEEETTFDIFTAVYCLAEALGISRLQQHILAAVSVKAQECMALPPRSVVEYLYKYGSKFCTLKNTFIDMYAIAELGGHRVFREELGDFPDAFVDSVNSYNRTDAFIARRKGFRNCKHMDANPVDNDDDGSVTPRPGPSQVSPYL